MFPLSFDVPVLDAAYLLAVLRALVCRMSQLLVLIP